MLDWGGGDLASSLTSLTPHVLLLTILAFAALETLAPREPAPARLLGRWIVNLLLLVINSAAIAVLSLDPAGAAAAGLDAMLPVSGLMSERMLMSVVGSVLLIDFVQYWLHRLYHGLPPLWWTHAVHHSDRDPDVTTAFRHHPLEAISLALLMWLLYAVAGIPALAIALYVLAALVLQAWQHANVRLPAGIDRRLAWLLVTPGLHRMHHQVDLRHGNRNFGTVFSVWDRAFGTFISPVAATDRRYGVAELLETGQDRLLPVLAAPIILARHARG